MDWWFFIEVFVGGLLSGVMYSLVALGFVLIFKASGVFNYVTKTFESLKFQTHWRFRTSSEKYKYLNDVMGIGFGYVLPADSEYNFQHDIYDVHLK